MPWPGRCARSAVSNEPCSSSTGSQIPRSDAVLNKGEGRNALARALFFIVTARSGTAPSKISATVPQVSTSRSPPSSSGTPSTSAVPLQSFAPKAKRCLTSCSPTLPRSAGSTLASMATTSGHPNRLSRGFGRCEIRPPSSSMPLSVRFRTDSAMTPNRRERENPGGHAAFLA